VARCCRKERSNPLGENASAMPHSFHLSRLGHAVSWFVHDGNEVLDPLLVQRFSEKIPDEPQKDEPRCIHFLNGEGCRTFWGAWKAGGNALSGKKHVCGACRQTYEDQHEGRRYRANLAARALMASLPSKESSASCGASASVANHPLPIALPPSHWCWWWSPRRRGRASAIKNYEYPCADDEARELCLW
jgi:hypothetical protein